MAKFYRYMGIGEFLKMSSGKEICPLIEYTKVKTTESDGVCFLGEDSFKGEYQSPEACIKYLKSAVSSDVLVEFEIPDTVKINESEGAYRLTSDINDFFYNKEYWMDSYDIDKITPLRYKLAIDPYFDFHSEGYEAQGWNDYDRDYVEKNYKEILKEIIDKTCDMDYGEMMAFKLEDWCSVYSSVISGSDGWYVENDLLNKTIKLAFGDYYGRDEENEKFSLSFHQITSEEVEFEDSVLGNGSYENGEWELNIEGNIPEAWGNLKAEIELFLQDSNDANSGELIKDFGYSRVLSGISEKIISILKYSMLKAMYPEIMKKYELSLDYENEQRIVIQPEVCINEDEFSDLLSLKIDNNGDEKKYSINNFLNLDNPVNVLKLQDEKVEEDIELDGDRKQILEDRKNKRLRIKEQKKLEKENRANEYINMIQAYETKIEEGKLNPDDIKGFIEDCFDNNIELSDSQKKFFKEFCDRIYANSDICNKILEYYYENNLECNNTSLNNILKEKCKTIIKEYKSQIENGEMTIEDIPILLHANYYEGLIPFDNMDKSYLSQIKDLFAEYYQCKEEELFFGSSWDEGFNLKDYKVIFGSCDFGEIKSIPEKVEIVLGTVRDLPVSDIGSLKEIHGHTLGCNGVKEALMNKKKKITAQDIGKCGFGSSVVNCDNADRAVESFLEKEKNERSD